MRFCSTVGLFAKGFERDNLLVSKGDNWSDVGGRVQSGRGKSGSGRSEVKGL